MVLAWTQNPKSEVHFIIVQSTEKSEICDGRLGSQLFIYSFHVKRKLHQEKLETSIAQTQSFDDSRKLADHDLSVVLIVQFSVQKTKCRIPPLHYKLRLF